MTANQPCYKINVSARHKIEKKILLTIAVDDMDNGNLYTKILGLFDKVPSEDFAKGMVMEYICDKYSIEREDYDDFIFEADVDAYISVGDIQHTEL